MSEPVFLPLMREPQPDTAERVRRDVQAIPWALPALRIPHCGQSSGCVGICNVPPYECPAWPRRPS